MAPAAKKPTPSISNTIGRPRRENSPSKISAPHTNRIACTSAGITHPPIPELVVQHQQERCTTSAHAMSCAHANMRPSLVQYSKAVLRPSISAAF